MTTISTNPVASLAALLREAIFEIDRLLYDENFAEPTAYTRLKDEVARGVQYAPREPEKYDMNKWCKALTECCGAPVPIGKDYCDEHAAAPPREPPPAVKVLADEVRALVLAFNRGDSRQEHIRALADRILVLGRPEGPSAPPPQEMLHDFCEEFCGRDGVGTHCGGCGWLSQRMHVSEPSSAAIEAATDVLRLPTKSYWVVGEDMIRPPRPDVGRALRAAYAVDLVKPSAAEEEIARLRQVIRGNTSAQAVTLIKHINALMDALKPFASEGKYIDDSRPAGQQAFLSSSIVVGDLRRAREAFELVGGSRTPDSQESPQ